MMWDIKMEKSNIDIKIIFIYFFAVICFSGNVYGVDFVVMLFWLKLYLFFSSTQQLWFDLTEEVLSCKNLIAAIKLLQLKVIKAVITEQL